VGLAGLIPPKLLLGANSSSRAVKSARGTERRSHFLGGNLFSSALRRRSIDLSALISIRIPMRSTLLKTFQAANNIRRMHGPSVAFHHRGEVGGLFGR